MAIALNLSTATAGSGTEDDDWGDWDDAAGDTSTVNDGGLAFLTRTPGGRLHHHANRVLIGEDSLQDGWVTLQQCHTGLDPVARLQIVYHPERVRQLAVTSQQQVQSAEVVGARVELSGVGEDAKICISAQSQALVATDDGGFVLRNGPYMRRFLDGFFPMRVSMAVRWPAGALRLGEIQPVAQPGFAVVRHENGIDYEALFEGRLSTEIHLFPL